jgi:ectoine hydroxylase
MLMPGSHKRFIACAGETPDDNHKSSLKKQEVGVPSHEALTKLASGHGITPATGKAGTLLLFDCNTMHGSNGNITPFPRSNAFFVFNAMSNQLEEPFGAKKPRPDFLAQQGDPDAVEVATGKLV